MNISIKTPGVRVLWVALADGHVLSIEYSSRWSAKYPKWGDFKRNFSRGWDSPVTHTAETEGNAPGPNSWVVNTVAEEKVA